MANRWKRRPEGSNWGDFGPEDELGRLNLLTPERVLAAVREVRAGRSFCLSLPLDLPGGNLLNPNRFPPERHVRTRKEGRSAINYPLNLENPDYGDVVSDDAVTLYTQYSTQWDGLCHVGHHFDADDDGVAEPLYYNGFRPGADVLAPQDEGGPAARRLGIEKMAATGVQGRGVLVDLHAHLGRARTLVGYEQLMKVMEADGVVVEEGDMLCLHTGFGQMLMEMDGRPDAQRLHDSCAALDGRDERLQRWITESGISVLVADNYAVEAFPNAAAGGGCCAALPLHELCLFKLGIHLGELWYLTELAAFLQAEKRSRFLLTAPPLRLPGSFGSPLTPVATV